MEVEEVDDVRNALAQQIRVLDGNNTLPAKDLGWKIAEWLINQGYRVDDEWDIVAIVESNNADKGLGAARLADVIVDELDLDT